MAVELTSELIAKTLIPQLDARVERNLQIQNFFDLEEETLNLPKRSTAEHVHLATLARTPYSAKIVSSRTRRLKVSGVRDETGSNSAAWKTFKGWKMVIKEKIAYREAVTFGTSLIEQRKLPGGKTIVLNKSPFTTTAFYSVDGSYDSINADFPVLVMERVKGGEYRIWDDENVYTWTETKAKGEGSAKLILTNTLKHGFSTVPFSTFIHDIDSSGNSTGVIWPIRHLLLRLQKATHDSGVINHSNSWNVRYATGMASVADLERIPEETDEEYRQRQIRVQNQYRLEISTDSLLTSTNENAKFGTLSATDPASFIPVIEDMRKELASVSETPSEYLTGENVAMSAEQSANNQANFLAVIDELRAQFAQGHETLFELYEDATKTDLGNIEIAWEEIDRGVLASVVDALVKSKSIGVPDRMLWLEYPNMNPEKYERWIQAADEQAARENATTLALMALGNEDADPSTVAEDLNLEA